MKAEAKGMINVWITVSQPRDTNFNNMVLLSDSILFK